MKITINESTVKCVPFAARVFCSKLISKMENNQNIKIVKDNFSKMYTVEIEEEMIGDIISVIFTSSVFFAASSFISAFMAGTTIHDFNVIADKYGFNKKTEDKNSSNNAESDNDNN